VKCVGDEGEGFGIEAGRYFGEEEGYGYGDDGSKPVLSRDVEVGHSGWRALDVESVLDGGVYQESFKDRSVKVYFLRVFARRKDKVDKLEVFKGAR